MKYLGIDYGESKVGLAIGDSETGLALPYKIIRNSGQSDLFKALADIIKAENIGTIVVGLPLNTRSQPSSQTVAVQEFAGELKTVLDLEVEFYDERFSSREAQKLGAGSRDDDVAAMIMLQSYLDANPAL